MKRIDGGNCMYRQCIENATGKWRKTGMKV